MSLFGAWPVADLVALLAQGRSRVPGAPGISFAELPAHTDALTIPTRHGPVPATVYWPTAGGPRPPAYLNFHGGGFVIRHPEQDDPLCRYLAAVAGVAVINVDYDVAPQVRFPTPVEEAYDAAVWAAQAGHGWDGTQLCIGGQSAGGALAAGAARLALEQGGPGLSLQVLHYPPLDLASAAARKRAPGDTAMSLAMGEVFAATYAPTAAARRDRLASPAWGPNADDLEGIAPALVITCGADPLHDAGARYARRLDGAGALREYRDLPGTRHAYNINGQDRALVERVYGLIARHVTEATREMTATGA